MDTLGLYIHVPFCASKCSFCNFSSRVVRRDVYDRYCQAVAAEIERLPSFYSLSGVASNLCETPVDSVYFGGGTPSLMGAGRLQEVLAHAQRRFQFASAVEFTLEVTPGSADDEFLKRASALGINRLSIGAQSFVDAELRSVGRLHSADETRALIQSARAQGFTNISVDLIAGLPHQTVTSWQASLQSAIAQRPEHVSVYILEIDQKSRLGNETLRHGHRYHADAIPSDDFMADAYLQACQELRQAGYIQYEISNFALPGRASRHNRKYWQLKPYVGLGAGAHSFDGQTRWENVTSVEEYELRLKSGQSTICNHQRLAPDAQVEEFFFLGLRQLEGVRLSDAVERWGGGRVDLWAQKIKTLETDGWLERCDGRIRLADKSLLLSNEIFQEFIAV